MSGEELRALAEVMGCPEWRVQLFNGDLRIIDIEDGEVVARGEFDAETSWIAAANPTAVLAMLDELDALRTQVDEALSERDEAELSAMQAKTQTAGWVSAYDEELVRRKAAEVAVEHTHGSLHFCADTREWWTEDPAYDGHHAKRGRCSVLVALEGPQ